MDAIVQDKDPARFVDALLERCASLEGVKELLTKSLSLVNAKLAAQAKQTVDLTADERGEILLDIADVQLLEPRGRFRLQVTTSCLILEGKSGGAVIPVEEVVNVAVLPSHTSAKKEGEDYLVLTFDHELRVCGKDMRHLLFNLSKTLPKASKETQTEAVRVVEAVKEATQMKINVPNPNIFRSVASQKPFLRCHKGTQEGAIYPLYCGVFFIKPTLFVHVDEIASLSAGRGGGSGNTRFVDLHIETTEDKVFEFGNIEREELAGIQAYLKGYLEVRKRKKEEKKQIESAGPEENKEDDDDDDDDDDDYDPNQVASDDDRGNNSDSGSDSSSEEEEFQEKKKSKKRVKTEVKEEPRKSPKVEIDLTQ